MTATATHSSTNPRPAANPDNVGSKRRADISTKKRAYRMYDLGSPFTEIGRALGYNPQTIANWMRQREKIARHNAGSMDAKILRAHDEMPGPLQPHELTDVARDCLEDFERWRMRYLGKRSMPWQVIAAFNIIDWIDSPETKFVVNNMPPGSGKSTLFTHDIPTWLICRDRTIRIMLGHNVARQAEKYSTQMRRTLQRTRLLPEMRNNYATTGILAVDYGRFRPTYNDIWRAEEFTVMMNVDDDVLDESGLESKEPTVSAYGFGSEFLGARANFVVWDDLVTDDSVRTKEKIDNQRRQWDIEGETRVEPGGCLLLQGQRIAHDDLYHYALDQTYDGRNGIPVRRYEHVVFPAHHDEICGGEPYHQFDSPPWDGTDTGGCLLDPQRLRWHGDSGLLALSQLKPAVYEVQYQQRDISASEVLIPEVWIEGGVDEHGIQRPGCYDNWRDIGDTPVGLSAPWYSLITVDPSGSNFWAIEWWVYHPASEQHFLIDMFRDQLNANDLLDWNANDGIFYGILEDWVMRSKQTPLPVETVIVETNACQRWLLAWDHTKRWQATRGINVMPHQTGVNKLDPELGIQSLRGPYSLGQVRLPGTPSGRAACDQLVYEATRYRPSKPKAITDDCLMAQWFEMFNLQNLTRAPAVRQPLLKRPSWLKTMSR